MSNKTMKQRIAVVAASALTAGFLSVVAMPVAANAASDISLGSAAGLKTTGVVVTLAGSQAERTMTITSSGQITLDIASPGSAAGRVTITGGTFTALTAGGTLSAAATSVVHNGGALLDDLVAKPSAVGTMIIKAYETATSTTVVDQLTVTVVAAATIGIVDASESFAKLVTTATGSATTYTDTTGAATRTNGQEGMIDFSVADGNGVAMPATTVISASATNGALVSFSTATQIGTSVSTTGAAGTIFVAQPTTHAPVSTVVTISVNGAVWTSKSLTITGDITKISVLNYTDGRYSSSSTGQGALLIYGYDSANNQVSRTLSAVGSLYDSVVSATTASPVTSATTFVAATYDCVARGAGKVQYSITNSANVSIKSPETAVRCSGDPDSWTAALDKAVYTPGSVATLTITAKDSKGNLTNGVATLGTAGTYAVTIASGILTAVTAPTTTDTFGSAPGVKTYKFTVGLTQGDYQLVVDLPKWTTAGAGSTTSATVAFKVASSTTEVSNADVLKSIVALIASINKQIQALQKLILKRK